MYLYLPVYICVCTYVVHTHTHTQIYACVRTLHRQSFLCGLGRGVRDILQFNRSACPKSVTVSTYCCLFKIKCGHRRQRDVQLLFRVRSSDTFSVWRL